MSGSDISKLLASGRDAGHLGNLTVGDAEDLAMLCGFRNKSVSFIRDWPETWYCMGQTVPDLR